MSDAEFEKIKSNPTDTYELRKVGSQEVSLLHYERVHKAANDIDDLRLKLNYLISSIRDAHLWSHINTIIEKINDWEDETRRKQGGF